MATAPTDTAVPQADSPEQWLGAWANSSDLAYCRDLAGRILAVNVSFARKFGRPVGAFSGLRIAELLHRDEVARFEANTEPTRDPYRCDVDHRWVTPQGVRWLAWEETGLTDGTGAVTAIRAVGRDFTRRRLAEEQFYRLSRAVEQSPVSIVITDLEGRPQYVNAKFTAVTGHTLEDLLDRNIAVLRDGHPDAEAFDAFWKVIRAGGEWRGELATTLGSGAKIWEAVQVSCLRNQDGEITNYLCLREDITERKQLEQQLRQAQKMESLGTLAGGIAHDFNNLLAIINGYAEFCQQPGTAPAVLQKSLQEIHRAALRASGLVRQILTFSRKTDVKFSAVELNQLVRDLTTLMTETFPRTVRLHLGLEEALPPLLADTNQLQQIVLNLCVNARDAMPNGGTVAIRTSTVAGASVGRLGADPARRYACLQVTDTGTGMSPEIKQRIFEPFFTTKSGAQGTGLGLAVVYGIVVAHHGFIDVESAPGRGSTFCVYLPLADMGATAPSSGGPSNFPIGTESLLIIDDEESLRTLLSAAFGAKGYTTTTAQTGVEAIELITDLSRPFDAALLDLNMPGATGIEVLKVIRMCRPRMKVAVVSGHITPAARAEFEQLGQRYFLQKPYTLHELGRQLRQMLDAPQPPGA